MVIIAKMNVLSVGIGRQVESLSNLPIRLVNQKLGNQAVRSFKTEQIDSVICHWQLPDMPNGVFLKKLKAAIPDILTIAIIEENNPRQEIEARSLGVTAVISEDAGQEYFRLMVSEVLGLSNVRVPEPIYAVKEI